SAGPARGSCPRAGSARRTWGSTWRCRTCSPWAAPGSPRARTSRRAAGTPSPSGRRRPPYCDLNRRPAGAGLAGESVLELIADRQDRMRPSERKVAAAVLADPGAVVHMAMAGLAEAAGVSEPTVMRFCTAPGFGGFRAFRLALAQALVLGPPTAQAALTPDHPVGALAGPVFGHALRGLDRARRHLDPAALAAAVDALVGARAVHFVGLGAAGVVAQDAAGHAVACGVPCTAPADLHRQYATAAACRPGDVVVAICPTGR